MMPMRLAALQDVKDMARIACANPFSAAWTEQEFEQEVKHSFSKNYIAQNDKGGVVAFICYRVVAPSAELTNFAVAAACQKQGYGRFLLRQSLAQLAAEGVKEITLEVDVTNLPAVNLYRQCGFTTVSLRKKFYNNSRDAALMRLTL